MMNNSEEQGPKFKRRQFLANLLFAGSALTVASLQKAVANPNLPDGWKLPPDVQSPNPKPTPSPTKSPKPPMPGRPIPPTAGVPVPPPPGSVSPPLPDGGMRPPQPRGRVCVPTPPRK